MARPTGTQSRAVVEGIATPKGDLQIAFCEAWLKHYDIQRAFTEAGYKGVNVTRANNMYRRFERYLVSRKEKNEKAKANHMAIEQSDILQEMKAIAFANPQDYVVEYTEVIDGKQVPKTRRKFLNELTREQAAAVSKVQCHPDGTVSFELPDPKMRRAFLRDLGQHIGMFHPTLIQEHRHQHVHAITAFRNVDPSKLALFEKTLLEAMGKEGKMLLGIREPISAQYEDVTEEE